MKSQPRVHQQGSIQVSWREQFFFIKDFILDITMQLDISTRLTPQVTTIICHHMKNILLKKEERNTKKKYGGTKPKLIC